MKILYFIDCLTAGGKERRLIELMKGIKKKPNFTFEVVVMSNEIDYKEVFDLNIQIHYLIRGSKKDLTVFKKFYSIAKNFKPDIIHCWDSMTAVVAVPTCKLLNILLVNGMVIDTPVKQNILNKNWFRARLTFPFSSIIIGNSKAGLAAYNAPADKSLCIYNGMDLTRFKHLKDPINIKKEIFKKKYYDNFVVGMVANFAKRKDYNTLIKAAIELSATNNNIDFVFVGDGEDFNNIKNSVPENLQEKIFFLGNISNVEDIINIFDVGVLLTNSKVHGEGISNSIIEYMALGKPVIATRGGGTNEVVFDNENGYLIDSASKKQLIEKLNFLMSNKTFITKLGNRGREMAEQKFDLKIMTANYIQMYEKLYDDKHAL